MHIAVLSEYGYSTRVAFNSTLHCRKVWENVGKYCIILSKLYHVTLCYHMLSHMLSYVIYIYITYIYIVIRTSTVCCSICCAVRGALPGEARAESSKQDLEEAPHVPMYDVWKKFRRNMEQIWNKCRHMNENNEI